MKSYKLIHELISLVEELEQQNPDRAVTMQDLWFTQPESLRQALRLLSRLPSMLARIPHNYQCQGS